MPAEATTALLRAASRRLEAAGVTAPMRDARILLAEALATDRAGLLRRGGQAVGAGGRARFEALLERRARREPVSRILGRREFWSLALAISPAVLDPRPDSETVVETALALVPRRSAPPRVLDLGTGSGCLLLALLHEIDRAFGVGVDISPAAVATAAANARRLGLARRAAFVVGNWGTALAGEFDLIVANPPYVATADYAALAPDVRQYDPRLALDGGADGLDAYRRLAPRLGDLLAPDGHACLEIGVDQAGAVGKLMTGHGLRILEFRHDLAGRPRCVVVGRTAS